LKDIGGDIVKKTSFLLILGVVSILFVLLHGTYTYSMLGMSSNQYPGKQSITTSLESRDFSSEIDGKNSLIKSVDIIFLGLGLVSIAVWGRKLNNNNPNP